MLLIHNNSRHDTDYGIIIAAMPQTMESNLSHCLRIPLVSTKLDIFGRLTPKNDIIE